MIPRARRLPVVLSLLLVAGVLLMHVWTGASGEHMAAHDAKTAPAAASQVTHAAQPAATADGETAGPALAQVVHMPAMQMTGCAAILLLVVALALPGLIGSRPRLRIPARWLPRSTSACGPPPDLNIRLCVLRT